MPDPIRLTTGALEATISPQGAEMVGLRHVAHGELLWSGDAAWWDRQSPILFPVTGRCTNDAIRIGEKHFPMPLHGFAHAQPFEVVEAGDTECRLRLRDSAATRAHYPFSFELDLVYRLSGATLHAEATIANMGGDSLPASFGFHPGFRWPLDPRVAKQDHFIRFDGDEHLELSRADRNGFMLPGTTRLALDHGRLRLDEALFAEGATVFFDLRSRRIAFEAGDGGPTIEMVTENLPALLLWMRPGADFLCLEPWAGQPDPVGFEGQFRNKPGLSLIPAGEAKRFAMAISVVG